MSMEPIYQEGRPAEKRSEQEEAIYDQLEKLSISFSRADHEHADNMEACRKIEAVLGAPICKNLFLCNRQQTEYYLLMMPGEKPFKTKFVTQPLGCSRLSFAGQEAMEQLLHTIPGSVSALELIFDTENRIKLVMDEELMKENYISGHPGFSTSTVKLTREDFLNYMRACNHEPVVIAIPVPEENK